MKKLMLFMFVMVLMFSFASAAEFDNSLRYEKEDMKVTIENIWGLPFFGSDLGTIELKSHKSVSHVLEVGFGKEEVVMYYDFTNWDYYENGLGNVSFIDIRTGETIKKDYYFVEWTSELVDRDVYEKSIKGYTLNGTAIYQDKIIKTIQEEVFSWQRLESKDIPNRNTRIGLKTYVGEKDIIDAVWTVAGKEIEKHATWTANLNVDILNFWKLNESSGTLSDALNKMILTEQNSPLFNQPGIIATSVGGNTADTNAIFQNNTAGPNDRMNFTTTGDFSSSFWVNSSDDGTGQDVIIATKASTNGAFHDDSWSFSLFNDGTPRAQFNFWEGVAGARYFVIVNGVLDGDWHNVVVTRQDSGTNYTVYVDGALVNTTVITVLRSTQAGNFTIVGDQRNNRPFNGLLDEFGIWNRTLTQAEVTALYNGGAGITHQVIPLLSGSIDLIAPANNTGIFTSTAEFRANSTVIQGNLTNTTLTVWYSNGTFFRKNSTSITGTLFNDTNLTIGGLVGDNTYLWNFDTCIDNSTGSIICNMSLANRSITRNIFVENLFTFNSSSFETATETFYVNITSNGTAPTAATFTYNNTAAITATITNTGGNFFNLSATRFIPLGPGNKTFFFNFSIGGVAGTSVQQQNISFIDFAHCNVTNPVPYINFSFKNETLAQEDLTATIDATFTYSLSDTDDISKTLTFSNATQNLNYTFCSNPGNRPLNIILNMTYNNADSQQRAFTLIRQLTSVVTQQVLYLLPTQSGLFSQFKTVTNNGDTVINVRAVITRVLGGSTITVVSGVTDGSGFINFFLNPDVVYTGSFTKTGFTDTIFTFIPTTDIRSVLMGGGTSVIGNGTVISRGTNYTVAPVESVLNNDTVTRFWFNVTSNQTITLMSMNITNSTGDQLLFVSQASAGQVTGLVNTSTNNRFVGYFVITTAEETITFSKVWIVAANFEGDYSISRQLGFVPTYGWSDFIRIVIVLAVIMGTLIFMMNKDILEGTESTIMVAMLMVWVFSLVGWLDTGLVNTSTDANINVLAQFSSQFGIAILSSVAAAFFILRRVFIRRI